MRIHKEKFKKKWHNEKTTFIINPFQNERHKTDFISEPLASITVHIMLTLMVSCSNRHSVQFSRSVVSNSLQPHELQHAKPPCPSPTPRVYSNSCPLCWWCHPTFSPLLSPSPPDFSLSQHQGLSQWVSSSHQVAKVLELQLQHQSFQWIFRTDFL